MDLLQDDTVIASMTVAVAAAVVVGDAMTLTATVDLVMTVVTEATDDAIVMMATHLAVSIAMPEAVTTVTAAAVEMIDVVVAAATPTVMTAEEIVEVTVEATVEETEAEIVVEIVMVAVHPEMLLHQPPMVIQLLVGSQTDHTEVDTMARETPVAIDR